MDLSASNREGLVPEFGIPFNRRVNSNSRPAPTLDAMAQYVILQRMAAERFAEAKAA